MAALQQVKPAKPQSLSSLPVFLTADFFRDDTSFTMKPLLASAFSSNICFKCFLYFLRPIMVYKNSKIYYNNLG